MKVCKTCSKERDSSEFYAARGNKLQPYCIPCYKERVRQHSRKIKLEVINAYGIVCYCCSEANPDFLCIDHIYRDGHKEREKNRGLCWWRRLRREGFPDKDRLRTSCYNCNMGREANGGICPHQK